MYCSKCGKEVENGAKFCQNCGAALEAGQSIAKPNIGIHIEGKMVLLIALFLVVIWEGVQPWIKIELPFIGTEEIQWYKIFKIIKEMQEVIEMYSYHSTPENISAYSLFCMIPLFFWGIAGLAILYTAYLLFTRERKAKVLGAAKWALRLCAAASVVSAAMLIGIGIVLSSETKGFVNSDVIRPTAANYVVLIVSLLGWKLLIPKYEKEIENR